MVEQSGNTSKLTFNQAFNHTHLVYHVAQPILLRALIHKSWCSMEVAVNGLSFDHSLHPRHSRRMGMGDSACFLIASNPALLKGSIRGSGQGFFFTLVKNKKTLSP
jgi:hypothetical protein